MVALINNAKFHKLYPTRMADHLPHHHHPAWSAAVEAFEADVSRRFQNLFLGSEAAFLSTGKVSLSWLRRCLETLPYMNGAFARLIAIIDHPMTSWCPDLADEYLSFTLNLLEHLNKISSEISHLGHARVSLAHALSVSGSASIDLLKAITSHPPGKDRRKADGSEEHSQERMGSGKDATLRKAINFMKGIEFWVCGVVVSALSGDSSHYLEMRASAARLLGPSMFQLDSNLHEAVLKKGISLEEVRKINDSVASIVGGRSRGHEAEEALHDRLDGIEELMEGLRKDVDLLFSQVLSSRNTLVDCLRAGFR